MTFPASRALTVVAPIDPVRRPRLVEVLQAIAADLRGNPHFVPEKLEDTHFTRFVIVDDPDCPAGEEKLPTVLAWECNHDGRVGAYLRRAHETHAAGFDAIFAACPGYPVGGDASAFARWMKAHSVPSAAFYCGYRHVPRAEVVAARNVRDAIRSYLDRHRDELCNASPVEIQRQLVAHVRAQGLDLRDYDRPVYNLADRVWAYLKLIPLLRYGPFYWRIRRQLRDAEATEPADAIDAPVHGKPAMIAREDFIRQNQLTHLVDVKPGTFRPFMLKVVAAYIEALARGEYVHGDLGGITSIHFARWCVLPDPRDVPPERRRDRLIFFSNYDFSWDSYLGEFVDRQSRGLTAVWSNTVGFPPTRDLTDLGAADEERFKQWTRNHQIGSDVWWSGVRDSTVENVRDDVWIRRALRRPLGDEELSEWLRRL
jgi:hypothetical protein